MTTAQEPAKRSSPQAPHSPRRLAVGGWAERHPLGAFLLLAFGLSWAAFVPAALGAGEVLIVVGAFGPAAAAATVTRWTGGSIRTWVRSLWHWRVPARYYLFALALPPALVGITNLELSLIGEGVHIDPPGELVPGYVASLMLVALLGGGQEEPGWRGFALDRFQQRHSPVPATLLLGAVWGAWHLPVYGVGGFAGPLMFVTFYTWLYNRTRSVPLCVLLHAGLNTAVQYLALADHGAVVVGALAATAIAASVGLIAVTRGRLGMGERRLGA